MTKPNTVPNTVNSWFETLKSVVVNFPTAETTRESVSRAREWVCVLTREKKRTSGQMSLTTVAWSFFHEKEPWKRGFSATMKLALGVGAWGRKREKRASEKAV